MRSRFLWAALALVAVLAITTAASATTRGLITGKQIAPHAINSKHLVNHTIQKHDLSNTLIRSLRGRRGPTGPTGPAGADGLITTDRVSLTQAELASPSVIRAFVQTDSTNLPCLVTLAESNYPVGGQTVYCAPRDFNGQHGLLISVFYPPGVVPLPANLLLIVTIYQDAALQYGAPTLYTGP